MVTCVEGTLAKPSAEALEFVVDSLKMISQYSNVLIPVRILFLLTIYMPIHRPHQFINLIERLLLGAIKGTGVGVRGGAGPDITRLS